MVSHVHLSTFTIVTLLAGCSLVNPTVDHTGGSGARDAGTDARADVGNDAGRVGPPRVRVVHLARDTASTVDVYAGDMQIATSLAFERVSTQAEAPTGMVRFNVSDGGVVLVSELLGPLRNNFDYTLAFYGDAVDAPFVGRDLGALLLEDDASGIAPTDIRLTVIHLATPVSQGQFVTVDDEGGFDPIVPRLDFPEVARLDDLRAARYRVAFDIGANGELDVTFALPSYINQTYANVFIATRPDESVFLFSVNSNTGTGTSIDVELP